MSEKAFQDYYPDHASHCYGCGRMNTYGLHIKSYWHGNKTRCEFAPSPYHTAVPGFVYGGLIASVIDCHSTGSASAAAYRAVNRPMGSDPPLRFVTAALHVDFLNPTPIDHAMVLQSTFSEIKPRKVVVQTELTVEGILCARGEVVAVLAPPEFFAQKAHP